MSPPAASLGTLESVSKLNWKRWDPSRDGYRAEAARPTGYDEPPEERHRPGQHRETPAVRARLRATEAKLRQEKRQRLARLPALVAAVQRRRVEKLARLAEERGLTHDGSSLELERLAVSGALGTV
jgi:hypothetical protein